MKNGTVCGGVAGVPWPKRRRVAADPAKDSFIFSLGETPTGFDLVDPDNALCCTTSSFGFGCGPSDLMIWSFGKGCSSCCEGAYAGPRGKGLVGEPAEGGFHRYKRWELWRL
jgi:hypothetical protein